MAHFLLIHGSWHGSWCWERLTPILEKQGHTVNAPTLVGLAERAREASPNTGLATHIDQICTLILSLDHKDLIVAGHSYAGLVMAGVAERLSSHISRFIYIDAFIPDHGQCAFDLLPGAERDFEHKLAKENSTFLVPPPAPQDLGIIKESDAEWVGKLLTPMPIMTHSEKVEASQQKALKIPSVYIHCLQFVFGAYLADKGRREGWRFFEIDCGHDIMITHPLLLSDIFEKTTLEI